MRGIQSKKNESSSNRKASCSYCRDESHSAPHCPHAPLVWSSLQRGIIPLDYLKAVRKGETGWRNPLADYYSNGRSWGELFVATEKANDMVEKRLLREKTKNKKKAVQTCGFCKEKGHTRRSCSDIKHWKSQLKKANRNFREWFYQEYVVEQGLSTGAIIGFEFSKKQRYNSPKLEFKAQSIVTDVNWDSINVFALLPKKDVRWSDDIDGKKCDGLNSVARFFQSPILCKVPTSEDIKTCIRANYGNANNAFVGISFLTGSLVQNSNTKTAGFYDFETQGSLNQWEQGDGIHNVKVVSRAKQVLPSDWVDGYSDEMEVVLSKFSFEILKFLGITDFLDQWATSSESGRVSKS